MPMSYVTYSDLIQIGLLIVAIIGLVYEIVHNNKSEPLITKVTSF